MAQLRIPVDDFNLVCRFTCLTQVIYDTDENGGTGAYMDTRYGIKTAPETASKTVTFGVNLPNGAMIKSAQVHAKIGSPLYGADTSKINGVSAGVANTVAIDVDIADGATTVDVPFQFLCHTPSHAHENAGFADNITSSPSGLQYHNFYYSHESSLEYKDVYLLIEYTPSIEFTGWTDDPLVLGETFVKAVHMTELQQWTAVLSEYADNGTPTFTEAVPGETSLSQWLSQVQEIRAVLDVISPNHEAWIDVRSNCPRADVMTQLREIIVAAI